MDDFLDIQKDIEINKESYKDIRDGILTMNLIVHINNLRVFNNNKLRDFLNDFYEPQKSE
jgi:hypothetical protein